jgi:hypothetical protein
MPSSVHSQLCILSSHRWAPSQSSFHYLYIHSTDDSECTFIMTTRFKQTLFTLCIGGSCKQESCDVLMICLAVCTLHVM